MIERLHDDVPAPALLGHGYGTNATAIVQIRALVRRPGGGLPADCPV